MTGMVDRRYSASENHGGKSDHVKQAHCLQTRLCAESEVWHNNDAQLAVWVFCASVPQQAHYCPCKVVRLFEINIKLCFSYYTYFRIFYCNIGKCSNYSVLQQTCFSYTAYIAACIV